ncbi:nitrate- and nitrite sensing domain-containing protein [Streptomyces sp. NPDC052052]|uniref:sensor histidine kinase n=1 Tax=Streptomyces sp. NPDC052052 TaxID=3154756 RepID=UPI00342D10CD
MRPPRTTPDTGATAAARHAAPPPRGRRAHAGPPADESAEHGIPLPAREKSAPRGRRTLRPRTVRAKIISLLMVPVVSLLVLWGFATVTTAQEVARLRQSQRVDDEVRRPMATAVAALQSERRAAVLQYVAPSTAQAAELERRTRRTDTALAALRLGDGHTIADTGTLPATVADRLNRFLVLTHRLRTAQSGGNDEDAVYDQYTEALSAAFDVSGALTGVQDDALGSDARVLHELDRADEMLAREDALLAAAARTGTLEGGRLRRFVAAVETRRTLTGAADLSPTEGADRQGGTTRDAYRQLLAEEDKVLAAPAGHQAAQTVPAEAWEQAASRVRSELRTFDTAAGQRAADRADPLARGLSSPSGAAVLFGCVAVTASLVISVRIGRGLVVELVGLRNSALEIAHRKLPRAMQRLRSGEALDVAAEAPRGPAAHDEISQVGEALGTVHRAALDAAVERAELADGISGVFVNLARRSQVLVHRQLSLLDRMERRVDDPEELGDLFRLDHLTTRMRRHAESLIILSGAAPGRAWRIPVQLTDVVRAAVSEIEDYARVEVRHLPDAAVKGTAVADVTHLLAELIENAAQFSPPHTKVRVSGEPVGNGYALEVEDRGLGMGKEILDEANRRIEQAEDLALFDSDRLGLFVVSRLSARHRIRVQLRISAYGGTTAVILLPTALLQSSLPPADEPQAPGHAPAGRGQDRDGPPAGPGTGHGPYAPGERTTAFPAPVAVPALVPHQALESRTEPVAAVTLLRERPGRTEKHGAAALPRERPGDGTLPQRVRQASLAPQLREEPRPDQPPQRSPEAPDRPAERTPEQARDRMTAYRNGWVRGGGTAPGRSGARPGATEPRFGTTDRRRSSEGDPA